MTAEQFERYQRLHNNLLDELFGNEGLCWKITSFDRLFAFTARLAWIIFNTQLTLAQRKGIWVQLKIDFPGLTEYNGFLVPCLYAILAKGYDVMRRIALIAPITFATSIDESWPRKRKSMSANVECKSKRKLKIQTN